MQEGVAHHRAGRLRDAETAYRRVLAALPDHADALHLLGLVAHNSGDHRAAVKRIGKAIKRNPSAPDYHNNLGEAHRALGAGDRAIACYRRAIGLNADFALAHNNLGIVLIDAGRVEEAAAAFERAIAAEPKLAWAHNNLGNALTYQGRFADAVAAYERAIALRSDYADAHNNLGNAWKSQGKFHDAVAAYRRAIDLSPGSAALHTNLGNALVELGQTEAAMASFARALEVDADHADAHFGRGDLFEKQHEFEAAREAARQVMRCAADHAGAALLLARLDRRQGKPEEARGRLDALLGRDRESAVIMAARAARGQISDELGDYAAAFADFEAANRARFADRSARAVDRDAFLGRIARNRRWFSGARVGSWPSEVGGEAGAPVFLVGFPRSGTTLTEQMLHAHPNLTVSDELPVIWGLMNEDVPRFVRSDTPFPDCLDELKEPDIRALRERYWGRLGEHGVTVAPGRRFVDKLPLNIVDLGFVRRVFPDSPVLVALRDPRDVCLSCFMQDFRINQAMVHFLDLGSTAALYTAVMDLWLHYRSVLGLSFLEFRYEDLVADVEATVRALLAFIGEPWDDGVLRHAESAKRRFVSTPSYRDIFKPVSSRAVGRWRNYREQLAPVLPVLDRFVAQFGYRCQAPT